MEYLKDEIFNIKYNANLNRLEIHKENWTSKLLKIIKNHKFVAMTLIMLFTFSVIDIALVYQFIRVLQY